jgi:hypothetical protein
MRLLVCAERVTVQDIAETETQEGVGYHILQWTGGTRLVIGHFPGFKFSRFDGEPYPICH